MREPLFTIEMRDGPFTGTIPEISARYAEHCRQQTDVRHTSSHIWPEGRKSEWSAIDMIVTPDGVVYGKAPAPQRPVAYRPRQ